MNNIDRFLNGNPFLSKDKSKKLFYDKKNKVIGDYDSQKYYHYKIPNINGFIWRVSEIIENRYVYLYQGNTCKELLIDTNELHFCNE